MSAEIILETRDLTKEFAGFVAVNGVNLKVERGTIHALIGPNGAGKTTCFNLLTKFLNPTRGQILYKGQDITAMQPADVARLGVVAVDQWQTITVAAGESVTRCMIVGSDAPELHRFRVSLGEGAKAAFFVTNRGDDYTRVELEVRLAKGAHFEFGGVTIGGGAATRAAEQIPLELLTKVHALKDGQSMVVPNPQGFNVIRIASSQSALLSTYEAGALHAISVEEEPYPSVSASRYQVGASTASASNSSAT